MINPNKITTEQMLEFLQDWMNQIDQSRYGWDASDQGALNTIRSHLTKYDELKADLDEATGEIETWKDSFERINHVNAMFKAEVDELKDDLLSARGDTASNMAQADSFAKLYGEAKAELEKARPLLEACDGLLAFIREKFPKDFAPGGSGYLCPHHRAIDTALTAYRAAKEGKC